MKTILGLEIEEKPFAFKKDLPLYISGNYDITQVSISGFDCIFMRPEGGMGKVDSIKKHIAKVEQICGMHAAIHPDHLTSFRRDSFLKNRVPFVTDKQVYLPFMGTQLEASRDEPEVIDSFTAAAQVTLIRWLMDPVNRIRTRDLMNGLGYTLMTESRVAKQLSATGCFHVEKDGNANVLTCDLPAKEVFQRLKKNMISPVDRAGYIDLPAACDVTVAGTEALSERTMLSADEFHTYAVYGIDRKLLRTELVDPSRQAYAEVWKYDPKVLIWKDGMADPISVALSLEGNKDERIEAAVNDMLGEVWR